MSIIDPRGGYRVLCVMPRGPRQPTLTIFGFRNLSNPETRT